MRKLETRRKQPKTWVFVAQRFSNTFFSSFTRLIVDRIELDLVIFGTTRKKPIQPISLIVDLWKMIRWLRILFLKIRLKLKCLTISLCVMIESVIFCHYSNVVYMYTECVDSTQLHSTLLKMGKTSRVQTHLHKSLISYLDERQNLI